MLSIHHELWSRARHCSLSCLATGALHVWRPVAEELRQVVVVGASVWVIQSRCERSAQHVSAFVGLHTSLQLQACRRSAAVIAHRRRWTSSTCTLLCRCQPVHMVQACQFMPTAKWDIVCTRQSVAAAHACSLHTVLPEPKRWLQALGPFHAVIQELWRADIWLRLSQKQAAVSAKCYSAGFVHSSLSCRHWMRSESSTRVRQ